LEELYAGRKIWNLEDNNDPPEKFENMTLHDWIQLSGREKLSKRLKYQNYKSKYTYG